MLDYNSNQNLLKGLKSNNRLASVLYNNRAMKLKILEYLRSLDGSREYTKLYDVCCDALGKEEIDKVLSTVTFSNTDKG